MPNSECCRYLFRYQRSLCFHSNNTFPYLCIECQRYRKHTDCVQNRALETGLYKRIIHRKMEQSTPLIWTPSLISSFIDIYFCPDWASIACLSLIIGTKIRILSKHDSIRYSTARISLTAVTVCRLLNFKNCQFFLANIVQWQYSIRRFHIFKIIISSENFSTKIQTFVTRWNFF